MLSLPGDLFKLIISHLDNHALISLYQISSFIRSNLESWLRENLIKDVKFSIDGYQLPKLLKLNRFPFNYISYSELNSNNIRFNEITNVIGYNYATNTKVRSQDKVIKLNYEYHNIIDEFFIVGCEMEAKHGILLESQIKPDYTYYNEKIYDEYDCQVDETDEVMKVKFDMNNKSHLEFIYSIDIIYKSCINIISNNKRKVGMNHFSVDVPRASGFQYPIIRKYRMPDLMLQGNSSVRSTLMYFNLSPQFYDNIRYKNETVTISKNTRFSFVPLLHIKLLHFVRDTCRFKIMIYGGEILNINV